MDDKQRLKAGEATRRKVLGDAWVDRSKANRTEFNGEWVDYLTRAAWGDVWQRPGLDLRARSIIVMSVCISLRHWDEFRLHVRGARNNGLTDEEIREVILHCAVYAGVPSANRAFKEAEAVLKEPAA